MTTFSTIQLRVIVFYSSYSFVCLLSGVCVWELHHLFISGKAQSVRGLLFRGQFSPFILLEAASLLFLLHFVLQTS